jgi:ferrous-iron efflux pump FieF
MTLGEAHDVADEIERRLIGAFPQAEVLVHQEPAGLEDDRLDHRIEGEERRRRQA